MDPWFVTGFADAEGCFSLSIVRNKERQSGWAVKQSFTIGLHEKDKALLQQIQSYLGTAGNIHKSGSQLLLFRVQSVKDLAKVIDHFDKYPLITKKLADYKLFRQAFMLILNKEHRTMEGLRKVVSIKATMNRGLSDVLKTAFPKTIPVQRPIVENQKIPHHQWLAGFTTGEGSFSIKITNSSSNRLEFQVQLAFTLTQHERDKELMSSLVNYLDCGNVYKNRETVDFQIKKFNDLTNKFIPFFQNFPIQGVKRLDYLDWCKVAELMQNKEHLTAEGLNKIRKIKAGMNKGRQ